MLGRATLHAPSRDRRNICLEASLISAERTRRKLDERMQGYLHPGALLLTHIVEVRVNATKDCLMGDDDDVLATLQLHDDGFETDHNVTIRLAATIAIVVFVVIASFEIFWIFFFDLLVSQSIADARVKLVERLPFKLVVAVLSEEAGSLNSPFESRGPDDQLRSSRNARLLKETRKCSCVLFATGRYVCVPTDLAFKVVLRFAMLIHNSLVLSSKIEQKTYTREPDRARFDMQVLKVVDQTAGQVILDLVDDDKRAHIDQLDVGVVLLVLIDRLIDFFVVADAIAEIFCSGFRVLTLIIWRRRLDFEDVVHDEALIIAL